MHVTRSLILSESRPESDTTGDDKVQVSPKFLYIASLLAVACPVVPSRARKLAIGASRPDKYFRISCPRSPPIMAHTGDNS
jgi:hypothetical protein